MFKGRDWSSPGPSQGRLTIRGTRVGALRWRRFPELAGRACASQACALKKLGFSHMSARPKGLQAEC
jgi:hypothetical protein